MPLYLLLQVVLAVSFARATAFQLPFIVNASEMFAVALGAEPVSADGLTLSTVPMYGSMQCRAPIPAWAGPLNNVMISCFHFIRQA